MNEQRRTQLKELFDEALLLKENLTKLSQEEQAYFDSLPPRIQIMERGEMSQEFAGCIREACLYLDDCINMLNEVV